MEVSIKFSRTNEEFSLQFSPSASRFLLLTLVYPFCGAICLTFFRIFVDTLLDERQVRINWRDEIRRWMRDLLNFIAYCLFGFASLTTLNRLTQKVPEEMVLKSTCWFIERVSVLIKPITYLRQKSSNISFFWHPIIRLHFQYGRLFRARNYLATNHE
uniref:Uncharacterized protein n=1 Tax=Ditylenchus dipsaci TaxID=166011 RepID=A0A915CZL4_9BILA